MKKIVILFLVILFCFIFVLLPSKESLEWIFHNFGFYFIMISFFFWCFKLITNYKHEFSRVIKENTISLVLAIFLSTLIFFVVTPGYKVLEDETNLIAVSKAMYQNKYAAMPLSNKSLSLFPIEYNYKLDKRPIFYPYLLSLLHTLTGYRPANAFVVNYLATVTILFSFSLLCGVFFNRHLSILAMFLLVSCPVFGIWVTSAGFEAVNLCFILMAYLFLYKLLRRGNVKDLEIMILTLLLLAQCRYESFVFTTIFVFLLPWILKQELRCNISYFCLFLPIFFIPVFIQRRFFADIIEPERVGHNAYVYTDHAFGIDHLWANIGKNIYTISGFDPNFGFSPLIFLMGLIGCYILLKKIFLNYSEFDSKNKLFFAYLVLTLFSLSVIIFTYRWGDLSDALANRFSMVFLPHLIILALLFISQIKIENKYLVMFVVAHLVSFLPFSQEQKIVKNLSMKLEYESIMGYLSKIVEEKDSVLIVAPSPTMYIAQGFRAINFHATNNNAEMLQAASNQLYDKIFVIQRYYSKQEEPLEDEKIVSFISLKHVKDYFISDTAFVRISEIIRKKP